MCKVMRDKLIFVMFFVGMSLSMFIVLNGYQLMTNWVKKYESMEGVSKYNAYIEIFSNDGMMEYEIYDLEEHDAFLSNGINHTEEIIETVSWLEEDAAIANVNVTVGDATLDTTVSELILAYHGTWNRLLEKGRYPTMQEWQTDEIYVVLGAGWKDVVSLSKDGTENLLIDNQECTVTGWLESYGDITDQTILIFASMAALRKQEIILQRMGDAMKYKTSNHPAFTIEIMSDEASVVPVAETLVQTFKASGSYYGRLNDYDAMENGLSMYYKFKMIILILLYITGMVNCTMIARVWYARQRNDLIIMKMFGIRNQMILKWQFLKVVQILSLSCVAAFFLNEIYSRITGVFTQVLFGSYSLTYLVLSVGILFVVVMLPLYRVLNGLSLVEELRGCRT